MGRVGCRAEAEVRKAWGGKMMENEDWKIGSVAEVQPRLIQGVRSGDGVSEDQDTIASIRHYLEM